MNRLYTALGVGVLLLAMIGPVWAQDDPSRVVGTHESFVYALALSPDGAVAVSGGYDGIVIVWDVATGEELRRYELHTGAISSLVFSPDGAFVASGSQDKEMHIWDVATGEQVYELKGHGETVTAVAYSPDGAFMASGSEDMAVRLYDAATGDRLAVLRGHTEKVDDIAFTADSTQLLVGTRDGKIAIWDVATETKIRTFDTGLPFMSLDVSADGTRWLAAGWGSVGGVQVSDAKVYDAETVTILYALPVQDFYVGDAIFSPDGTRIYVASNVVDVWDAETGEAVGDPIVIGPQIKQVAIDPTGEALLIASDRQVDWYPLSLGEE